MMMQWWSGPGEGWGGHDGWYGPPWWGISGLVFLAIVLIAGWFLVRRRGQSAVSGHSAESVLSERFARGEIDEEEFQQRLAVLRQRRR